MKKILLLLFFISYTLTANSSMQTLDLIVNAPFNTPDSDSVYLTGDFPTELYWKPDAVRLEKIAPFTYKAFLKLPKDIKKFEYKITRGSWATQASDSKGIILPNQKISLPAKGGQHIVSLVNWSDLGPLKTVGNIVHHKNFYSPELDNVRTISVWLPPSYEMNLKKYYPVIYMHDGNNVFDPNTSTFGVDWAVDDILLRAIENNNLPEAIVVGIFTDNRYEEYDDSLLGEDYGHFIVNTLKPFIDKTYRSKRERTNTSLMGSSMGALISFTILWNHSDIFSKAAGLSFPAFINNEMIFDFLKRSRQPKKPIKFYFDHGDAGIDSKYEPSAQRFHEELLSLGFPKKDLIYKVFPYADHTEADWARRLPVPLEFLLN